MNQNLKEILESSIIFLSKLENMNSIELIFQFLFSILKENNTNINESLCKILTTKFSPFNFTSGAIQNLKEEMTVSQYFIYISFLIICTKFRKLVPQISNFLCQFYLKFPQTFSFDSKLILLQYPPFNSFQSSQKFSSMLLNNKDFKKYNSILEEFACSSRGLENLSW